LLSDVKEIVYTGAAEGNYEPSVNDDSNVIREIDEKFASFNTINQLEFINGESD